MGAYRQSSLRMLAPASLLLFAVVFLVVVVTSLSGGSSPVEPARTTKTGQQGSSGTAQAARPRERRFYTVKSGDNLFSIAAKTGVAVEKLQALNPSVDPQGLVAGQRIKLR